MQTVLALVTLVGPTAFLTYMYVEHWHEAPIVGREMFTASSVTAAVCLTLYVGLALGLGGMDYMALFGTLSKNYFFGCLFPGFGFALMIYPKLATKLINSFKPEEKHVWYTHFLNLGWLLFAFSVVRLAIEVFMPIQAVHG